MCTNTGTHFDYVQRKREFVGIVQFLCWIVKELVQGAHGVLLMDSVDDVGFHDDANKLGQTAVGEIMHLM